MDFFNPSDGQKKNFEENLRRKAVTEYYIK